jgi:hypothetical protein
MLLSINGCNEKTTLMPWFSACFLQYFKWFVDNIFGIWIGTSAKWEHFKLTLPFKNLSWKATYLALKADFLDLTLELKNVHVITKMFAWETNKSVSLHPFNFCPFLPLECLKALFLEMSIIIGIKIPILMITDV